MKEQCVSKIVSHLPPRHLDDFLAVALLKERYPTAEVEFVHPQGVPEEYFNDRKVILVDVGGKFDPRYRNYDHHQDKSIPSSLKLVMISELSYVGLMNLRVVEAIDQIDRFGFKKAFESGLVKPDKEIDKVRKTILAVDLRDKSSCYVGKSVLHVFSKIKNGLIEDDFNAFIINLYEDLDRLDLLKEAKEKLEKEEREFKRRLEKAEIVKLGNLKVLFSSETLAPRHSEVFRQRIDMIVERNSMNSNHSSFLINTQSEKAKSIKVDKIFEGLSVVFRHPTGFITVVDMPFEEFSEIVRERMRIIERTVHIDRDRAVRCCNKQK